MGEGNQRACRSTALLRSSLDKAEVPPYPVLTRCSLRTTEFDVSGALDPRPGRQG